MDDQFIFKKLRDTRMPSSTSIILKYEMPYTVPRIKYKINDDNINKSLSILLDEKDEKDEDDKKNDYYVYTSPYAHGDQRVYISKKNEWRKYNAYLTIKYGLIYKFAENIFNYPKNEKELFECLARFRDLSIFLQKSSIYQEVCKMLILIIGSFMELTYTNFPDFPKLPGGGRYIFINLRNIIATVPLDTRNLMGYAHFLYHSSETHIAYDQADIAEFEQDIVEARDWVIRANQRRANAHNPRRSVDYAVYFKYKIYDPNDNYISFNYSSLTEIDFGNYIVDVYLPRLQNKLYTEYLGEVPSDIIQMRNKSYGSTVDLLPREIMEKIGSFYFGRRRSRPKKA